LTWFDLLRLLQVERIRPSRHPARGAIQLNVLSYPCAHFRRTLRIKWRIKRFHLALDNPNISGMIPAIALFSHITVVVRLARAQSIPANCFAPIKTITERAFRRKTDSVAQLLARKRIQFHAVTAAGGILRLFAVHSVHGPSCRSPRGYINKEHMSPHLIQIFESEPNRTRWVVCHWLHPCLLSPYYTPIYRFRRVPSVSPTVHPYNVPHEYFTSHIAISQRHLNNPPSTALSTPPAFNGTIPQFKPSNSSLSTHHKDSKVAIVLSLLFKVSNGSRNATIREQ